MAAWPRPLASLQGYSHGSIGFPRFDSVSPKVTRPETDHVKLLRILSCCFSWRAWVFRLARQNGHLRIPPRNQPEISLAPHESPPARVSSLSLADTQMQPEPLAFQLETLWTKHPSQSHAKGGPNKKTSQSLSKVRNRFYDSGVHIFPFHGHRFACPFGKEAEAAYSLPPPQAAHLNKPLMAKISPASWLAMVQTQKAWARRCPSEERKISAFCAQSTGNPWQRHLQHTNGAPRKPRPRRYSSLGAHLILQLGSRGSRNQDMTAAVKLAQGEVSNRPERNVSGAGRADGGTPIR